MRICYVVVTCEKYLDTRVNCQLETMFKSVPLEDIYFLGHKSDPERRLFSWGAPDDYNSAPFKLRDFFFHMTLDYDWYIIIDDDTYVYTNRLMAFLQSLSHSDLDRMAIGKILDHVKDSEWGYYYSGGAGTVLSRGLYKDICNLIQTNPVEKIVRHNCGDICLGMWIKYIVPIPSQFAINNDNFHLQNDKDKVSPSSIIMIDNIVLMII